MCLDDACNAVESGGLFSVTDTTLSVSLDASVDWSNFYVTAERTGFPGELFTVPFSIKICGDETLTTVSDLPYKLEINLSHRDEPWIIDTTTMFTNDDADDCPVVRYSLSTTNTGLADFQAISDEAMVNFAIDDSGSFTVTPTMTGLFEMYVMAETESAVVSFKHFIFNMTLDCDLVDTNPMWQTQIMRNQSILDFGSIDFDLLEVWSYDSNYRQEITAEYCKVTSYQLCDDPECVVLHADTTRFSITGSTLTLFISRPLPQTTVFLVATRDGYPIPYVHSLQLEYCGYE
jgi:hypothetical protein